MNRLLRKIRRRDGKSRGSKRALDAIWRGVRVLVGICLVYLIWKRVSADATANWPDPGSIRILPAMICLTLMPVNVVLEVSVWRRLLLGSGAALSFRNALPAVLAGFAAGAVSPGGVGDFLGRVVRVAPGRRWVTGIAMAFGRVAETILYCAVGLIGTAWVWRFVSGPLRAWVTAAAVVSVPLLVALLLVYTGQIRFNRARRFIERFPTLMGAREASTSIPTKVRVSAFALSACRFTIVVAQFALAVYAFSPTFPSPLLVIAGVVVVLMLRAVAPPVTFMGLGIREAASVGVLGSLGIPVTAALVASLYVFATNLALPALVGVPFLLFPRWNPIGADSHPASPTRETIRAQID